MNERLVGCGDGSCLINEGIESSFCQCLTITPLINKTSLPEPHTHT